MVGFHSYWPSLYCGFTQSYVFLWNFNCILHGSYIILISQQFTLIRGLLRQSDNRFNIETSLFHLTNHMSSHSRSEDMNLLQMLKKKTTKSDPWVKQKGRACENNNSPYKGWCRSVCSLCLYFWRNFSARSAACGMSGWLATALLTTCSIKTRTGMSHVHNQCSEHAEWAEENLKKQMKSDL